MKVIWKRPDGFHQASPSDYTAIEIASSSKVWLHKKDQENFPFRISGGWQDEESTKRLNRFVNLLDKEYKLWQKYLKQDFNHSNAISSSLYLDNLVQWLQDLGANLKGDTWEVNIMLETVGEIIKFLTTHKDKILSDLT